MLGLRSEVYIEPFYLRVSWWCIYEEKIRVKEGSRKYGGNWLAPPILLDDSWYWRLENEGNFTTKSLSTALFTIPRDKDNLYESIWAGRTRKKVNSSFGSLVRIV